MPTKSFELLAGGDIPEENVLVLSYTAMNTLPIRESSLSVPPEAIYLPLGENARASTAPV